MLGFFILRLDGQSISVVADEGTVDDSIAIVPKLMPVPSHIKVGVLRLIPLGDGLVEGNG